MCNLIVVLLGDSGVLPFKVESRGPKVLSPDSIFKMFVLLTSIQGDCLTTEIIGCNEMEWIQSRLGIPWLGYLERDRVRVDKSCLSQL